MKQCGLVARAIAVASFEQKIPIYRAVVKGIKIRRVTIAEEGGAKGRRRILPQRIFRMRMQFDTDQLMRFGKSLADGIHELLQNRGFSDTVIAVTVQIRTNAKEQKVILLEQGYTTVSANFSELSHAHTPESRPQPASVEPNNAIQRAIRWKALLQVGGKTVTQIAGEEKVSKGLISQHVALLALPQMIIDFLKEGRDQLLGQKFSLRKLQRLGAMSPEDAINAFQLRIRGQPVQSALKLE